MYEKNSSKMSASFVKVWLLALLLVPTFAFSQQLLQVTSSTWAELTAAERSVIQGQYIVELSNDNMFAVIVDNQGVDRSTGGTVGGAVLGEAIASATYIDRSFDHHNYSAKTHLGMMLLGGFLGSALDRPPSQKYQFRYTVRSRTGEVSTYDIISNEPFRHAIGLCVRVPDLAVVEHQRLCTENAHTFRLKHGLTENPERRQAPSKLTGKNTRPQAVVAQPSEKIITCRIGALAPVTTTTSKCRSINGYIAQ